MSSRSKVTRLGQISQVIAGIEKRFMGVPTVILGRKSYTPAEVVARLTTTADALKQTSNARAAYLATVQVERNEVAAVAPLLRYVKTLVIAQFGNEQDSAQDLEDFGYTPRKLPPKDVAVKAEAAVKARATRVARGTKGKRQKAKIKGTPPSPPPASGSPPPT